MAKYTATAVDVNAWQMKHNYKRKCAYCVREYYESLVGVCPVSGKNICMYCCRNCDEHYQAQIGQGCRARDRERGTD